MDTSNLPEIHDAERMRIIAILCEYFPGNWFHNGHHRTTEHAYYGEQVLGPASLYVELTPRFSPHWEASMGDGLVNATLNEGMAESEDLAERGILPGSDEELREVLAAFQFNLGQALEEMRRAHIQAVGHPHTYVEPSHGR